MSTQFDYIVVGAGSAGCCVASRLSEDPGVKLLLLEAGPDTTELSGELLEDLEVQHRVIRLLKTELDWDYSSEPEPRLNNRRLNMSHGKVVGGTSAFSPGTYVRGTRANYERWAALGNPGWSYEEVLPYFIKLENFLAETPFPQLHGKGGPQQAIDFPVKAAATDAFLAATHALGYRSNPDFAGPDTDGAGLYQFLMKDDIRVTAANGYLTEDVRRRANLTIEPHALTHRLLLEQRGGGVEAIGVEYQRDGTSKTALASREVIVCCGAYDSPKLLMLSGIGPADELRRHGIAPVVPLPGVGRNYNDNLVAPIAYKYTKETEPPGLISLAQVGGLFVNTSDPSKPDFQLSFNTFSFAPPGQPFDHTSYSLAPALSDPLSRGRITLRSADPADPPRIFGGFLSEPEDMESMLEAVKISLRIMEHEAFDKVRGPRVLPPPSKTGDTDESLRDFIRDFGQAFYHPKGTCAMGPDPHGQPIAAVVDHRLRVHGVRGLRIADASIIPSGITGNTHTPIVMIGEKAAEMIMVENSAGHTASAPAQEPPAAKLSFMDVARETTRLSMAASLFGAKQMAGGVLNPKSATALSNVTESIKGQLGGPVGQLFELGDKIQQGFFGAVPGAAPARHRELVSEDQPSGRRLKHGHGRDENPRGDMRKFLKTMIGLPWTMPRMFFEAGEKMQQGVVERILPETPSRPPGQQVRSPEGGYIWFSDEQEATLKSLLHEPGPIFMVNLFRLRPDGGAERFNEYVKRSTPLLNQVGAKVQYLGHSGITFIGPETWDLIGLVEWPSAKVYHEINFENEAFNELKPLRASGLVDSRFYYTRKLSG